ncbi:haloacid dehalogenase-like hydrolase [Acinetobacter sp. ABJ_C1_1]|uniref:haloacid dehalogenase-like hydrolase n=1 Tax=Acinetobacter sp. ABJ_C1_1 TaxID=3378321 RepID=UPI0026555286|nr:haloacid dehalogenase-like hydrolase [Acinetobacter baumannii]
MKYLVILASLLTLGVSYSSQSNAEMKYITNKIKLKKNNCKQLDPSLQWSQGVREFLQSKIEENSTCIGTYSKEKDKKVAIFDWDDTVIKNGVGYLTNYYMLRKGLVLQPPKQDWRQLNKYLSDAAVTALNKACGTNIPAGHPLPTNTNIACADEIISILSDKTSDGEAAFTGFDHRRMEAAYLWSAALSTGYSSEQLSKIAREARKESLSAPIGAKQKIGSKEVNAYNRYYPQIKDLIQTLQAHGIEVWILSASPEPIVKVWSSSVGVDAKHTIGIRSIYNEKGKQTPDLYGCGDILDKDNSVIPTIDGKRCWANKVIFGVQGKEAWEQLSADRRQIIAGGDSVTDVTFVNDATVVSIAINRNKPELMCRAYDGLFTKGGKWAVNKMFIEPFPKHNTYDCSNAYVNSDGTKGPVLRMDGTQIADQEDLIY